MMWLSKNIIEELRMRMYQGDHDKRKALEHLGLEGRVNERGDTCVTAQTPRHKGAPFGSHHLA